MNMGRTHTVDLSDIKVVDQHCHIFPHASGAMTKDFFMRLMSLESYNPDYLLQQPILSEYQNESMDERHHRDRKSNSGSVIAMSERSAETTLLFKESVKELARFLRVASSPTDVVMARNDRAISNYESYVKDLFADARIQTMLVSDYPYLPYTDTWYFWRR